MKKRDVIFTIIGIMLIGYAGFCFKANRRAKSINCTFNLSAICLGTTLWADDSNQGKQPGNVADLIACSNEISTTKVLICPADNFKKPSSDFSSIGSNNLSYELIGKSILTQDTNSPFLRCEIHGHLGYSFGFVSDGKQKFIPANQIHAR
jgi:hypothetical protein